MKVRAFNFEIRFHRNHTIKGYYIAFENYNLLVINLRKLLHLNKTQFTRNECNNSRVSICR